jgi:hypothetical protein
MTPWLVQPWNFILGSHLDIHTGVAERRTIASNVFQDTIGNRDPVRLELVEAYSHADPFLAL